MFSVDVLAAEDLEEVVTAVDLEVDLEEVPGREYVGGW